MKKYYPILDILKFVFSIFILLHHAEINLLINQGTSSAIFATSYLAVEGFLVISGYLIAASVSSLLQQPNYSWRGVILHRCQRIYPAFIACLVVYVLAELITKVLLGFHHFEIRNIPATLLMLGDVFVMEQIIGFWYMPVFFWGGFLYIYLLLNQPKLCGQILMPAIVLIGYSWIYHRYGALPLHAQPYVGTFVVGGLLRGLAGLALGIVLFNLIKSFKHELSKVGSKVNFVLLILLTGFTIRQFFYQSPSSKDFLVLFFCGALLIVAMQVTTTNLKLVALAKYLGVMSYYIFLLHICVFNLMIDFGIIHHFSKTSIMPAATLITILLSAFMMKVMSLKLSK